MKIFIVVLILSITWTVGFTQDTYVSRNSTITLLGEYKGESIQCQSHALMASIDYESTKVIIRFPLKSIKTPIDSLNFLINKSKAEIYFEGFLDIEYISTDDHSPILFQINGVVISPNLQKQIQGSGELHHIGETTEYACRIGLEFELDLKEFGINDVIPGLKNEFKAIINQMLLRRDKN